MLTPSPAAAAAPTSATRGSSPVPSSSSPSHHNNSSNTTHSSLDTDGYVCSACGYSVLHSHPQLLIECHYCAQWFHRTCVSLSERDTAAQLGKYACYACSSSGGKPGSDFSRYLSASSSGRHGVALYKKNSDVFRLVLKTGYFSRAGVRVLQPQVGVCYSFLLDALRPID